MDIQTDDEAIQIVKDDLNYDEDSLTIEGDLNLDFEVRKPFAN